jgi:GTPase SAR1 family protein
MIPRRVRSLIQDRLASSPAVGLIGPRQCGKTTLSRSFAGEYFDQVQDLGKELWALEVKLTTFPSGADMERLTKTADMIGATRRFLVSKTAKVAGDDHRTSCNLKWLLEFMQQWPTSA